MKKLLILLALCMVVSVVLVACDNNTGNEETTPEVTTDPTAEDPTTEEATTEEATTEPGSDESSSEEATTDPGTTPDPVQVVAGLSWDSLTTAHPVNGKVIVPDGGAYTTWDGIANIDTNDTALKVWGWVAYFTATEGTVGYAINGGETVYGEGFTYTAEEGVQTHIATNVAGALSACRMQFEIPVAELGAGEHTIAVIAKDTEGNEETIKNITVKIEQVDPVEAIEAIEFDGTNGAVTVEADGTVKFMLRNQGGKKIVIENATTLTISADNLAGVAVPLTYAEGTSIMQEIPAEGWDNIEVTIHNATGEAVAINFTVVAIG